MLIVAQSRNMIKYIGILASLISLSTCILAQNSLHKTDPTKQFKEGLELFQRKNYAACRSVMEDWVKSHPNDALLPEARYFIAISAINLFHNDGEKLIEEFVRKNPKHPKASLAYLELANHYYRNRKYEEAAASFEKVDISALSEEGIMEMKFKEGYSWFNLKETEKALENFDHAKKMKSPYQAAAAYYAGFLNIRIGNFEQAIEDLEIAEGSPSYQDAVPPLKAQAYYGMRDFDRVINYSRPFLREGQPVKSKNELYLTVADAYFQKKEYAEAAGFYEDFLKPARSPDKAILFRAGYSEFQTGAYKMAELFLKNAALDRDSIGQYASFILGQTYIKLDNKTFALSAFDKARKLDFSDEIREEAEFYYGKVAFENGNYSETITVYTDFKNNYPNSKRTGEINDLISQSYLNTNNLDQALAYIENLPVMSDRIKAVYQKVTFKKGTELFNAGKYYEAVNMLEKSSRYPYDKDILLQTYFWMGETYSIGNKYPEAIDAYTKVFENDPNGRSFSHIKSRYGIGYAYYNTGDYTRALNHFRAYVERVEAENTNLFLNDALLRLADCYYAVKEYNRAIDFYNLALSRGNPEKDYGYFQIGMVYGIEKNITSAIENFNRVIEQYPDSRLVDDAMFYKAQVTFENGNYPLAIERFSDLIKQHLQSSYIPQAYVSRAIAYFNLKKFDSAISDYQYVLRQYPQSAVTNNALLGLQETLNAVNRTEELAEYIALIKESNPDNKNLESIEFESAKSLYYSLNYNRAIQAFTTFINTYPDSPFFTEANYYLGECYYRNDNKAEAVRQFTRVIGDLNSKWYNRSILRLAILHLELDDYLEAITYYQKLAVIARNKKDEYNAWSGLMECYYELNRYDSTIYYANLILEKGVVAANAQTRANLYLGKAMEAKGDDTGAVDYYLNTVNTAKDENAAESQYRIAHIFYDQGEYRRSIETLFNLNENFIAYDYWIGKSFILIARNYIELNEYFQAEATLNSVIERSPLEEIRREAQKILNDLVVLEQSRTRTDTLQSDSLEIENKDEF